MVRLRLPILILASVSLAVGVLAQAAKPRPTPTPAARPSPPARKAPPRVFTNDDLEATKDKPSAVQSLTATGGETSYEHAPETGAAAPPPDPTPNPDEPPPLTPEQARMQQLEADIAGLDAQAKQLLWQWLRSDDPHEIVRLKGEQQGILDQIEAAKRELAQLRGESPAAPTPEPTLEPG